jgi:hypothetical protein
MLRVVFLFLCTLVVAAPLNGDETVVSKPSPREGVLVMKSGAIFSGVITGDEDAYIIESPFGTANYPRRLVLMHCDDLGQAYGKLREKAQLKGTAAARIELAKWCVANRLFEEAREELNAALTLEANDQQAQSLLIKVETELKPPMPAADLAKPAEKARRPAALIDAEAESLGGLSPEAARQFSRRIQPMLMKNCATAKCHTSESTSDFRLSRVSLDDGGSGRLSQRNLSQVFETLDLESPRKSKLLTVSRAGHGHPHKPVFAGRKGEEQFELLRNWVVQVAREKTAPKTGEAREEGQGPGKRSPVRQDSGQAGVKSAKPRETLFLPRPDPFDPARFNQRGR